jgi:3-methyladenine DNA glycosylase Tag
LSCSLLEFLINKTNKQKTQRKLNTEPSIGVSHQVSVHLAKQLQRRRFLEINQSETRMACGGHVY